MNKPEDILSNRIIGAAIEVHKTLGGPGLIERVYEEALTYELARAGLEVQRQVTLPIRYKGNTLGEPLRMDLVIDDLIIVECKAVSKHNPLFEAQVLTYLRLSGLELGLIQNFGMPTIRDGLHRVVNNL